MALQCVELGGGGGVEGESYALPALGWKLREDCGVRGGLFGYRGWRRKTAIEAVERMYSERK